MLGNSQCSGFSDAEYLPVALQRAGYVTGLFGKFLNCYPSAMWPQKADGSWLVPNGWDRWVAHKDTPKYYDFPVIEDGVEVFVSGSAPQNYEPYWFRDRLVDWVDQQSEPWFAYFTPFGPHSPRDKAPGYSPSMSGPTPDLPNYNEGCPGAFDPSIADKPSSVQGKACLAAHGRANAKGAQWGVDQAFKSIYEHLDATGQLDNTVILFVDDNGVALGSHRISGKTCAYDECHAIPFMIKVPGLPGGDIERMISNLDVTPTLLELAGGSTTRPQDGQSLVPLLLDPSTPWREDQFLWNGSEKYRSVREDCAVRNPCYWYTEYEDGQRELYELHSDPFQLTQLLPNPVTGYPGQAGWNDPSNPTLVGLKARLATIYAQGAGRSGRCAYTDRRSVWLRPTPTERREG